MHMGRTEGQVAGPMDPGSPSKYGLLKKDLKAYVGIPSFLEDPAFAWSLNLTPMFIYSIWAQFSHPFCQCTPVNVRCFYGCFTFGGILDNVLFLPGGGDGCYFFRFTTQAPRFGLRESK